VSTSPSNAALDVILADYQRYHAVLVIVAGVFLAAVVVLLIACWRSLRAARRSPAGPTRRESWTYATFIVASVVVALFLVLVIVANLSNVMDPQAGFAGVDQSGPAMASWLASGNPSVPAEVQERIDARLAWQRPKAIIVTLLLTVTVVASVAVWRRWIARTYASRGANAALFGAGVLTASLALLLMLMVMGNVQASLAPVALTLAFG
jgi:hypothetical protein